MAQSDWVWVWPYSK